MRHGISISVFFVMIGIWSVPGALGQEHDVIAAGEIEYQRNCAICHGGDGKGRGMMSKFLSIEPSDLTQLAKKNVGRFPFWQVYRAIDGREEVRGHGTREMPIWGARFRTEAGGEAPAPDPKWPGEYWGWSSIWSTSKSKPEAEVDSKTLGHHAQAVMSNADSR